MFDRRTQYAEQSGLHRNWMLFLNEMRPAFYRDDVENSSAGSNFAPANQFLHLNKLINFGREFPLIHPQADFAIRRK